MWFTAVTVVAGVVLGLLLGGRPRHLPEHTFHLWPLLLVGLGLQVLVELHIARGLAFPMLLVSYGCILGFAALNLRLTGMGIVFVGTAMNLVPIAVNRGMPVRDDAIVAAGLADNEREARSVDLSGKRHVMDDDDSMTFLADIVPVAPFRQVVSFGDLVIALGTVDLVVHLLRPAKTRAR